MWNKDTFVKTVSIMLLLVAVVGAGSGIKNLAAIRPADDYEDKGVYEFIPYRVLPAQRENTGATGRARRLHPTRTVYVLHYKTQGKPVYRWQLDTAGEYTANKKLSEKQSVSRRVLAIRDTNRYLTVEPQLTAVSYTRNLRYKYIWIAGCSLLYIGYFIFYGRKKFGF